MSIALQQEKFYTVEEWLSWDEDVRCEIIDGKLYMMSPPDLKHQRLSLEITGQLWLFLKGKPCKVYSAPVGVRLSKKEQTVLEPDIIVVCDKSKLDGKKMCNGAPDMVVEILSPSTSRKDRFIKFNKYLKAGVREYWIVDPADNTVSVNILEHGFYRNSVYGETETIPVHVLEGCEVNLNEVFVEEENE